MPLCYYSNNNQNFNVGYPGPVWLCVEHLNTISRFHGLPYLSLKKPGYASWNTPAETEMLWHVNTATGNRGGAGAPPGAAPAPPRG